MIRYKKYQVTGEDSPLKGLWYARPVIEETFDIEKHGFLHQRIDSGRQERETG